ncbi:FmdE family protein [Methanoregula sp.]|uniref:FmdE family protein n=1 Tax=Methanoregula sp. TaxID=2052170 RepID=UPI0026292478|nr:FmdE family protein [Methanoregula sp.]MDD5142716.1 FmdE family protein [Methanoregula sp.]
MTGKHGYPDKKLKTVMDAHHVPANLQEQVQQLSAFHTYAAPGVLIGAFMVDYALELLGVSTDDKLYGVCETPKCLPDALQVIAHCTTGNNRLKVVPIGKFAITLNGPSDKATTEAVRVYVDLQKMKKYPVLDVWYANSPAYDKHTMGDRLQDEIFSAGREILSYEKVRIEVRAKKKWKSVTCPGCGETVPDYLVVGGHCGACGSMKYYEKI